MLQSYCNPISNPKTGYDHTHKAPRGLSVDCGFNIQSLLFKKYYIQYTSYHFTQNDKQIM